MVEIYCGKCCPPSEDGVIVTDQEVSLQGYQVEDHLGKKRLKLNMLTGKCIYLNQDNSCSIYATRPKSCRDYVCTETECTLYPKP